jgi:hypothetical protein
MDMTEPPVRLPDCTGVGDVLTRIGDKWALAAMFNFGGELPFLLAA